MNAHIRFDEEHARELLRLSRPERRDVEMRAFVVRGDKSILDVRVLDLSYDGCGIETVTELNIGEQVTLSVLSSGVVRATVKWCRGRNAGLVFGREQASRAVRQRRANRVAVNAEVFLRRTGKIGYRVKIADLSPHGCKCEFVDRPRIEEIIWLKFDHLASIESQVCWVEGSDCGIKFLTPIHPAVFQMLLEWLGK